MRILIIGEEHHAAECREKLGPLHEYTVCQEHDDARKRIAGHEVVFDFLIEEDPDQFEIYSETNTTIFLNTSKFSLAELAYSVGNSIECTVFGFNGLPTFFNRPLLEVSVLKKEETMKLNLVLQKLGAEYVIVDDRVGLVTPRVVCMIINEAYYTVQEGTATREDIDVAMKLGTNYPFGPFEWCQRIGIKHVFELLEAVYEDTKDERYKICPLLKREYLATT
ncbi:MAG TPA: 3-hydroxyacyl-CoA dehydrogenase family protein [Chryseosolibacter sp.]